MTLERRNPLPPGFYAIDVVVAKLGGFFTWRKNNAEKVIVRKSEQDDEEGITWFLFEVKSPVGWPSPVLGFPDKATATTERKSSFDPSKNVLDQAADALPKPADLKWIMWGGAIIIGLLVWHDLKD